MWEVPLYDLIPLANLVYCGGAVLGGGNNYITDGLSDISCLDIFHMLKKPDLKEVVSMLHQ